MVSRSSSACRAQTSLIGHLPPPFAEVMRGALESSKVRIRVA